MKKANKGREGQTKAREWTNAKFQKIFTFLGSLGVFYCMISIFLNFKVVKAKKAALLAGAAFFYLWKFILSKLVLYHPNKSFKLPLTQIWMVKFSIGLLKAKRPTIGLKSEEF